MCLPVKPFKIEREWIHAGLQCAVTMARERSFRCGYVRVPPGHPLHGASYPTPEVEVHGGLSFGEAESCSHEDGVGWWFGFDCGHFLDASYDPNLDLATVSAEAKAIFFLFQRSPLRELHEHYWLQAEVEAETERLAEQLAAVASAPLLTLDLTPGQELEYERLVRENADVCL